MADARQQTDPVRAYLEYFRDLGVHEFYRNGEPAPFESPVFEAIPQTIPETAPETAPLVALAASLAPVVEAPVVKEPILVSESASDTLVDMAKLVSLSDLMPIPSQPVAAGDRAAALESIRQDLGDCTRCPLAYAGRRTIVFGDGDPNARLMFVGEGPGADEDEQGLPFVGKSGQLLNNMITAMGLSRSEVYIANIVKCRPPANRAPEPAEANSCTQFLARQVDIVRPEVVVALGATAAMYLLGVKQSLLSLRGRWHNVRGVQAVVTYHPAFLLRDPRQKGEAWKDLQMVMAHLGLKPKPKE